MSKLNKIIVQGHEIAISKEFEEDYICLTDISKSKDGEDHIRNWMRNRNTLEYLGLWESLYNGENFKGVEFDTFRKESGLNSFNMTPKKWIESTNAIGIISKSGKYGGTYAHKDIAFNFASWLSPTFQLYIFKEYQRLKQIESNQYNLEWNIKRILSKTNYEIHTDAVKKYIIPKAGISQTKEWLLYADEADLLNIVLFGCTAAQWKQENQQRALKGENIRDMASINELAILSNLESLNSTLIKNSLSKADRFRILKEMANDQRTVLDKYDFLKSIKKEKETTYIEAQVSGNSDNKLKGLLSVPPNKNEKK